MFSAVSENHYFNISNEQYKQDAVACIEQFKSALNEQEFRDLLDGKFKINQPIFNENQFLQSACEISAASSIYAEFPQSYLYERKQSKNKDVDFSFVTENIRFNVEIKCFNYKELPNENPTVTLLLPQLNASVYQRIAANNQDLKLERSRLLNIRDFFQSAKDKFIEQENGEYNVLMISCYNIYDYIDVITCIAGDFGISFGKNESFRENNDGNLDVNDFKIIDAVVVNNLGHLHKSCHREKFSPYINPWQYRNSFSLGLQLHQNHKFSAEDMIGFVFKKSFNLYNDLYLSFCSDNGLNNINYLQSFPLFIDSLIKKGGHYFL